MKGTYSGMLEMVVWTIALIGLYVYGEDSTHHFSLCPLDNFGLTWCPGCGLGRSMHYFMHGGFTNSWRLHPLGCFGVIVIVFRIYELIKLKIKLWQMY